MGLARKPTFLLLDKALVSHLCQHFECDVTSALRGSSDGHQISLAIAIANEDEQTKVFIEALKMQMSGINIKHQSLHTCGVRMLPLAASKRW